MSSSQRSPGRPRGAGVSAVTMDSLARSLDQVAATGTPHVVDTDDLAALGLLDKVWRQATVELVDLAASHGCMVSGSYSGPPGEDSYYLFVPAKAA